MAKGAQKKPLRKLAVDRDKTQKKAEWGTRIQCLSRYNHLEISASSYVMHSGKLLVASLLK